MKVKELIKVIDRTKKVTINTYDKEKLISAEQVKPISSHALQDVEHLNGKITERDRSISEGAWNATVAQVSADFDRIIISAL